MYFLLTAIVIWLSANFDLPAAYQHPAINRMSSAEMTNVLKRGAVGEQQYELSPQDSQSKKRATVLSLYNAETRTIYLTPEWTGYTLAELSILIHEMVHHLQNIANTTYVCPQEREALAHEAQEKWLNLFGRSLSSEFKIDQFTLLLNTKCLNY